MEVVSNRGATSSRRGKFQFCTIVIVFGGALKPRWKIPSGDVSLFETHPSTLSVSIHHPLGIRHHPEQLGIFFRAVRPISVGSGGIMWELGGGTV